MTLPTEYRRQLFYFLGGSGVYAGIISLLYIDWLLISPYLTSFLLAAALAATLAPVRRIVSYNVHLIHDTSSKQRTNWVMYTVASIGVSWAVLELVFHMNVSYRTLLTLITLLSIGLLTLPSTMDRDTLTALIIVMTLLVTVLSVGIFAGNALVHESQIAIEQVQSLIAENQHTIERLKSKDAVLSDSAKYCVMGVNYLKDLNLPGAVYSSTGLDHATASTFCADKISFVQENAETYVEKARSLAQEHASTAGQHVAGIAGSVLKTFAALPMQTVIFLLLLFYFLRYEPRIRQEIWRLSPFNAEETSALVHSLNEKVAKTIGQSVLKAAGGFVCTYVAFHYVGGFEIALIFAFLAGMLELTPFTSPWLVWLPSLAVAMIRDGVNPTHSWRWVAMLLIYLVDLFYINIQIGSLMNLREQNPTVLSMSVLLGAAAFGPTGVILAPIASGITLVVLDMYKNYMLNAESQQDFVAKSIEAEKPTKFEKQVGIVQNKDEVIDQSKQDFTQMYQKSQRDGIAATTSFSSTKEDQPIANNDAKQSQSLQNNTNGGQSYSSNVNGKASDYNPSMNPADSNGKPGSDSHPAFFDRAVSLNEVTEPVVFHPDVQS